jgi:demethylmenaquinone methyltransferase / 2-methoxy-6-polyprenyl-1,4-benzoquinol methylase
MPPAGNSAYFGNREVPLEGKQAMIDAVFHRVASRYDLMNDLMSIGIHRAWKDALVTALDPPNPRSLGSRDRDIGSPRFTLLDLAGGTGDIALRALAAGSSRMQATVVDISNDMLAIGRERARQQGFEQGTAFVKANAEALPFCDRSYDAVTIAFGIRNVPRIEAALSEAHRVLRLGGRFLCLEFSAVDVPGLDAFYHLYSFNVIPALGRAVTGDAEAYRYLVESIRRFPPAERLEDLMRVAGFRRVSFQRLSGGIVALHSGWRL